MKSTIKDCTTATMSMETSALTAIDVPPALNAPNKMAAKKVPHGLERPSKATVMASKPMLPATSESRIFSVPAS